MGAGEGERQPEGNENEEGWVQVTSKQTRRKTKNIKTPEELRKVRGCGDRIDFGGFDAEGGVRGGEGSGEDHGNFEELGNQVRMLNFTVARLVERQERMEKEMKNKCDAMEKVMELNNEYKKNMDQITNETSSL